jgi:signal transduction histidine kinase
MPVEINTRTIQLGGELRYFSVIRDITERKYAECQLRKLTAHIQTVREEEKTHLAREIHDDLGSTLAALKIEAHQLDHGLSADQKATPLFARVESMVDLLDDALATTRRIITDLRPPQLDDLGLMASLEWQAEKFHQHTGIECRVACFKREGNGCTDCKDCEYTLDKTLSITLFRIFQEALTNVKRHSGASRVEVEFRLGDGEVALSISDNGRGLPQGHTVASTSYGIRGMRERVEQLGGKIELGNPLGGGFSVMVKLPQPAVVQ